VSAGASGAQKGARARGRTSWPRILATCASARVLVHGGRGEGGADRGGPRHRERKDGRAGQRLDDWQNGPTKQREKRGAQAKKPAPTAWPHWAASEREREREESAREGVAADRWIPLVRRRGHAGARPGWVELGQLGCFAFFLNFLIAFPFLFSRVFNSNSIQVSNSN
jgi:hypothetical protein